MSEQEILKGVVEVIAENFHVDKSDVKIESKLDDDLGLDSVDVFDSVYFLEDKFNIKLVDESPDAKFVAKTVGDVVKLVQEKINS